MLVEAGRDASVLWKTPHEWGDLGRTLDAWIEQVAAGIAHAATSATAVVDAPDVVIDGALPSAVRARIVERARVAQNELDLRGLSRVSFHEGSIGSGARAIGAGCLPLMSNFALDRGVLFKEVAG
jgi:predicted NBD/HSP70 family sugar kinase